MIDGQQIEVLADYLYDAQKNIKAVKKITASLYPNLSIEDAYMIQKALIQKKLNKDEKIAGLKMGLTSFAKLQQMNIENPVYGYLLKEMEIPEGGIVDSQQFIHPKVEPEIGFVLKERLVGPNVTKEEVLLKTDYIFPAIELIDSRYENFNFTMADVVADNTSAAAFILGTRINLATTIDLETIGVSMSINGKIVQVGAAAAVLGHPAESVAKLANMLSVHEQEIPVGVPLLTGGITEAVSVASGDYVRVQFHGDLGETSIFVQ